MSSRAFYFLYWLFDNLYIVTKIINVKEMRNGEGKYIIVPKCPRWDTLQRKFWQLSRICWLFGICMFMIYCIKTLRKTYTDESDLKVAALDKMTVQ